VLGSSEEENAGDRGGREEKVIWSLTGKISKEGRIVYSRTENSNITVCLIKKIRRN